jgi:hypothetical protein
VGYISHESSSHFYGWNGTTVTPEYDAGLKEARQRGLFVSPTTLEKDVRYTRGLDIWKQNQIIAAVLRVSTKTAEEDDKAYGKRVTTEAFKPSATASDFGTRLHDAIEEYPQMTTEAAVLPWMELFDGWYHANIEETLFSECMVALPLIGVAGRLDRIVRHKEHGPAIIDWKGLSLATPLPTPSGWTTMGDIQEGDKLFGADGEIYPVTAKSPIHYRRCYRITFDDTSTIECDEEHLWRVSHTLTKTERTAVFSSHELAEVFLTKKRGARFKIFNATPLQTPQAKLKIDPYLLGVWLGDGGEKEPKISLGDKKLQIVDYVKSLGYDIASTKCDPITYYIKDFIGALKQLGLWGNKHVPKPYLRASFNQRLQLLRGLMDTDGTWNKKRNQAVFYNTNPRLSNAVYELVVSLGWKATKYTGTWTGFDRHCVAHLVTFTPFDYNPFWINSHNKPLAQLRIEGTARARRRLIKSITAMGCVPTQCIQVASPNSLYLAGSQMVPTHNTQGVKKQPAFYDSWPRQLAFYREAAAAQLGTPKDATCISAVIDSTKPTAPAIRVWSRQEMDRAWLAFLCTAWLWFDGNNYWPVGYWEPKFFLAGVEPPPNET